MVFHADSFDRNENGKSLPCFVIPAGFKQFFGDDGIGFTENMKSITFNGADVTYTEGGTGEGVTVEEFGGETKEAAEFADFIFEETVNRFNEFEFEVFGETSDVVMETALPPSVS